MINARVLDKWVNFFVPDCSHWPLWLSSPFSFIVDFFKQVMRDTIKLTVESGEGAIFLYCILHLASCVFEKSFMLVILTRTADFPLVDRDTDIY